MQVGMVLPLQPVINEFNTITTIPELSPILNAMYSKLSALAKLGETAPDFTLVNNEGLRVSLSDFRGKMILLYFWSNIGENDIKLYHSIEELEQKYRDKDLVVIKIFCHPDTEYWRKILKENKWIVENPIINSYILNSLIFIKDFKFAPITGKILGYDFLIWKSY